MGPRRSEDMIRLIMPGSAALKGFMFSKDETKLQGPRFAVRRMSGQPVAITQFVMVNGFCAPVL